MSGRKGQGRKLNDDQRKAVAEMFEAGVPNGKIAEKFGITKSTVNEIRKEQGLVPKNYKFTDEERVNIVKWYTEERLSTETIGLILGRSGPGVSRVLKQEGVTLRRAGMVLGQKTNRKQKPQYSLDETVFDNAHEREQASYFIGLLLTDGCIHRGRVGQARFSLTQKLSNRDVVDKLQKFLKAAVPVKVCQKEPPRENQAALHITSDRLVSVLESYGITPRKTSRQVVDRRMITNPHFWRGVYDGDGMVIPYPPRFPTLCFANTSLSFVDDWTAFCRAMTGAKNKQSNKRLKSGKISRRFQVNGTKAIILLRVLYMNSTVSMDSKRRAADVVLRWAETKGW